MSELVVDLEAIRANTAAVRQVLDRHGLSLVGVTKGCLGEPLVGRAMLDGGAVALADTRDANLARLRRVFPEVELHRIHIPPPGRSFVTPDFTYVSTEEVLTTVSARASAAAPAAVFLVVEIGDGREGAPQERVAGLAHRVLADERLEFAGLAGNYACFDGRPEGLAESLTSLSAVARRLRADGIEVRRVSGGNSALLRLLLDREGGLGWLEDREDTPGDPLDEGDTGATSAVSAAGPAGFRDRPAGGAVPSEITEVRCGEALLFGHDSLRYEGIPGAPGPACVVRAEVLERYTKPSGPGFGPREVLNVGSQDLSTAPVTFARPGLREVGRSSDYLVVEAEPGGGPLGPTAVVEIVPSYYALVAAWTSPFVEVRFE